MTEYKLLQLPAIKYCEENNIKFICKPNTTKGKFRSNTTITKKLKGMLDIITIMPYGKTLYFEFKTPEKYNLKDHNRSQEQLEWEEYLISNSHIYFCLDNIESFKQIIDRYKD